MLFTQKELDVYGLIQPNEKKLEKAKQIHEKLNLNKMMTFKGFYIIWGEEVQHLNIKHINSFEQLIEKIKKYKHHRRKLNNEGKINKCCLNCIWRKTVRPECRLNLVTHDGFTWYALKHDNDCCQYFLKKGR